MESLQGSIIRGNVSYFTLNMDPSRTNDYLVLFISIHVQIQFFIFEKRLPSQSNFFMQRRRVMQLELEKVQQEIPQFKEDWKTAEVAKSNVMEELDRTNRLVEELKHKLERAQLQVDQAKQDSELALLRAQEMEQGIDDEASVIAQTQLTVAKERHEKAVEELKLLKEELISTHEQYAVLELTLELIASKESLS